MNEPNEVRGVQQTAFSVNPNDQELMARQSGRIAELEKALLRMTDLVRYQRHELHTTGLITDEEYARLVQHEGAVARLEGYDAIEKALAEAQSKLREQAIRIADQTAWILENDHAADIERLTKELAEAQQARERAEAQVASGYKSFCEMERDRDDEHKTRIKYQDLVYAACNAVDRIIGRKAPGVGIVITELAKSIARIGAERNTLLGLVGLLREALCWIPDGTRRTPEQRGAQMETADELRERITAALPKEPAL